MVENVRRNRATVPCLPFLGEHNNTLAPLQLQGAMQLEMAAARQTTANVSKHVRKRVLELEVGPRYVVVEKVVEVASEAHNRKIQELQEQAGADTEQHKEDLKKVETKLSEDSQKFCDDFDANTLLSRELTHRLSCQLAKEFAKGLHTTLNRVQRY